MNRLIQRCCPFLIGLTVVTNVFSAKVSASRQEASLMTPSGITAEELEGKVDSYLDTYIGDSIPGAVVVVVKDNEILLEKAYGHSNLEEETEMTTSDTTFELGSLTKMYTYTAVMQQVEAGKIDLNADIFTYLPEDFASELKSHLKYDTTITMMNLINNTAGFEERGFDIIVSDPSDLNNTLKEALLQTIPDQIYNPGEVMTSSSYCSALAGYIVSCVTDMEFSSYVQTNILDKLDASMTTIVADTNLKEEVESKKALPYGLGAEGKFAQADEMYSNLYPSGSVVTNADDLAKFMTSFVSGEETLLKADTIESMFEKTYSVNENAKGQCVGFYEYPSDYTTAYYHDGSSNGFSSMMTIVPDSNFAVGIMTNASVSSEMMYGLTDLLIDTTDELATESETEGLPSIDDFINQTYTGAKRSYSNVLEFVGYFGNCCSFLKGDNDTIILDDKEYRQIKPYVFEYAGEEETQVLSSIAKYIYFGHNEDGEVTKWSYGGSGTSEFIADTDTSAQSNLSLSIVAIILAGILCAILFSTELILTAIDWMHKKPILNTPRGAFRITSFLFVIIVLNVVSVITDLLDTALLSSADFFWRTAGNIGLAGALVASFGYFIYCRDKGELKKVKILIYGFVYAFITLFLYLLYVWKFFAFI